VAQTRTLIGVETGIESSAVRLGQCRSWVKSGKARPEHLLSAIPRKADFARSLRDVSSVPTPEVRVSFDDRSRAQKSTEPNCPHFRFSTVRKCSDRERLAHRRRCRALGHQNLVFVPACRRKASRRTAVRSG
jgi:hypothetical protein